MIRVQAIWQVAGVLRSDGFEAIDVVQRGVAGYPAGIHRPGDRFADAVELQAAHSALLEPVHRDETTLPVRD